MKPIILINAFIFSFFLITQENIFVNIENKCEIMKWEVTFLDYRDCILNGYCKIPKKVKIESFTNKYLRTGENVYSGKLFDNFPNIGINEVSISEAINFCNWQSSSLLTEKQFEEICTNFYTTIYPWGDEYNEKVIYQKLPLDSDKNLGAPISPKYIQNNQGIMHLIGYLFEMTQSCYDEKGNYYEEFNDNCKYIVVKGGSYLNSKINLNCKFRQKISIDGDFLTGFRCVRPIIRKTNIE